MKLLKKIFKIVAPIILILGVIAAMDSTKSKEELSSDEKKEIQAFFTNNADKNLTAEISSAIPAEDKLFSAKNNNNENKTVIMPTAPANKTAVQTTKVQEPPVVKAQPEPKPGTELQLAGKTEPEPDTESTPSNLPAEDNGSMEPYEKIQ